MELGWGRKRKGEKEEREETARNGLVALDVNEGVKNLNGFPRQDKDDLFFQHYEMVVLTIRMSLAKF